MNLVRREIPLLTRRATLDRSTFNRAERTVEVVWSTAARMLRGGEWVERYYEVLSLRPGHVRLDRLNSGRAPFVDDHQVGGSSPGVRHQLGHVARAWIVSDQEARALLRFSTRPDVAPIMDDVEAGVLTGISPGYLVHRMRDITQPGDEIQTLEVIDWEPFELSLVPIPADPGAYVRSANPARSFCEIETMPEPQETPNPAGPGTQTPPAAHAATPREVAAERRRVAYIAETARAHDIPPLVERRAIEAGTTEAEFGALVLEERVRRYESSALRTQLRVGEEQVDKTRHAITQALLHRCDPTLHPLEKVEGARDWRGFGLLELVRRLEEGRGRTGALGKHELVTRGLHTTSDFPHIVDNVANKRLLDAYEQAAQTHKAVAKIGSNPDFKPSARVRLGDAPRLKKVLEHGEITRGSMGEAKEAIRLETFARIVGLTRQAIINDDLSAFDGLVTAMGSRVSENEADLLWAVVADNPNLGDGVALFDAAHGNETDAILDVNGLAAARRLLRLQRGIGDGDEAGSRLNLVARVLAVPTTLELRAQQLVNLAITPNREGDGNPFYRSLDVVCEPRLDDISPTCWFLFVAPNNPAHALEIAYLNGQSGPFFERKDGFDVDGVEFKIRHDFGVAPIDYRGAVYSTGDAEPDPE